MDKNGAAWQAYYQQALKRPHGKRIEFALSLNQSDLKVAIDCGCGVGADSMFLAQSGYTVHGFDVNQQAVDLCLERANGQHDTVFSLSTFEEFSYPNCGVLIASSSLFFADPQQFTKTWHKIDNAIQVGGVFVGDFLGLRDSWATEYRTHTTPLSETVVKALFADYEVIRFVERDEQGTTAIGFDKHWHTYSVIAVKRKVA